MRSATPKPYAEAISVIGAGCADEPALACAREVGRLLAEAGFAVVCGGLSGVMRAACEGAAEAGGLTIGILPGNDRSAANPFVTVPVATGLGQMRNALVVANGLGAIAISGGAGTLSEIGHALKAGKPVVAVGDWAGLPGVRGARSAREAVETMLGLIGRIGR